MLETILSAIESQEEKILIENLYYKYESQMFSAAFAILKHEQDAEDAVQSAFLKIIEHLPDLTLDENRQTQALLTIITKNIALNEIQKRNRRLKHEIDIDIEELETISVIENFDKISFEDIRNLIDKLPYDLKVVIIMRYILDYNPKMIAELLGIKESAVYKRIAAARKLLKNTMEECYE